MPNVSVWSWTAISESPKTKRAWQNGGISQVRRVPAGMFGRGWTWSSCVCIGAFQKLEDSYPKPPAGASWSVEGCSEERYNTRQPENRPNMCAGVVAGQEQTKHPRCYLWNHYPLPGTTQNGNSICRLRISPAVRSGFVTISVCSHGVPWECRKEA